MRTVLSSGPGMTLESENHYRQAKGQDRGSEEPEHAILRPMPRLPDRPSFPRPSRRTPRPSRSDGAHGGRTQGGLSSLGSHGGHGHGHGAHSANGGTAARAVATPAGRRILAWLLLPVLVLTVWGLIASWPHDAPGRGTIDVTADTAGMVVGYVAGAADADGVVPVVLESGEDVGVLFPPEHIEAGVAQGATVRAL